MWRTTVILIVATALAGCVGARGPVRQPVWSASVDRGLFFVLRSCAGCHAVDAVGMSPNLAAPPFSIIRLRHNELSLERLLSQISREGHHEMPPIYMSDQEIRDVAAYIQTVEPVAPARGIETPATRSARVVRAAPVRSPVA